MKYRVWTFLLILVLVLVANVAVAQENQNVADEFEAFKKKLQGAGYQEPSVAAPLQQPAAAPTPQPTGSATSVSSSSPLGTNLPAPATAAVLSPLSNNPLGVAGNLPVGNQVQNFQLKNVNAGVGSDQREAYLNKQAAAAKQQAFEDGLDQLMPLAPAQIRTLLNEFKKTREATETPFVNPTPKTEVQTVSLDPSKPPIVIKTAAGYVTTVTILDSTGSPWAIQDVTWAGKFTVTGGETGSHILRIIPQTAHGSGNISIRLVDLITPITFSLTAGIDEVHYRFDARIPKQGPLAKAPIIDAGSLDNTVVGDDGKMVEFLEGTPPNSAEKLVLDGVDERTKAWRSGKSIYLRTPLTLLSPSWGSSVSSADGMNVYTLDEAPVLLLSDQGKMVKAYVVNELGAVE